MNKLSPGRYSHESPSKLTGKLTQEPRFLGFQCGAILTLILTSVVTFIMLSLIIKICSGKQKSFQISLKNVIQYMALDSQSRWLEHFQEFWKSKDSVKVTPNGLFLLKHWDNRFFKGTREPGNKPHIHCLSWTSWLLIAPTIKYGLLLFRHPDLK